MGRGMFISILLGYNPKSQLFISRLAVAEGFCAESHASCAGPVSILHPWTPDPKCPKSP